MYHPSGTRLKSIVHVAREVLKVACQELATWSSLILVEQLDFGVIQPCYSLQPDVKKKSLGRHSVAFEKPGIIFH
jgi:hypothetical protein